MPNTKTSAVTGRQEQAHRVRDFLLYIVIGVSVAVSIILLGVHLAKTGQKPEAATKWIGFSVLTLLVFWWTIRAYRPFWTKARFWRLIALSAAIHIVVGVGLLMGTATTALILFLIIAPLESFVLSAYLAQFLARKEGPRQQDTRGN